jgi:quercetin dioxygenase-like cupin family protein
VGIETYRAVSPPDNRRYGEFVEAGIVRGNAGSLVIINLQPGALEEHSHEQEHVGVVLEGEFSFTRGEEQVVLRAGDVYRVPAGHRHGVRCTDRAVIAQAREPSGAKAGCNCCG